MTCIGNEQYVSGIPQRKTGCPTEAATHSTSPDITPYNEISGYAHPMGTTW